MEVGTCLGSSGWSATWIALVIVLGITVAIGVGVGVYFLWGRRRGFMGEDGSGGGEQGGQLRATYY